MKKLLFALSLASLSFAVAYKAYVSQQRADISNLEKANVEALASCEITRGDNVKFSCEGEQEICSITYMGYTLTCSGRKVNI